MARVIIFGLEDFASLAHFYLQHDSDHEVAAFTVTRDYMPDRARVRGQAGGRVRGAEQSLSPVGFPGLRPALAQTDEPGSGRHLSPDQGSRLLHSSAT